MNMIAFPQEWIHVVLILSEVRRSVDMLKCPHLLLSLFQYLGLLTNITETLWV